MLTIGSTKRHVAHARGASPRGARSGPKTRASSPREDRAGGRNGRVRGRDNEAPDDEPAAVTNSDDARCQLLDYHGLLLRPHARTRLKRPQFRKSASVSASGSG